MDSHRKLISVYTSEQNFNLIYSFVQDFVKKSTKLDIGDSYKETLGSSMRHIAQHALPKPKGLRDNDYILKLNEATVDRFVPTLVKTLKEATSIQRPVATKNGNISKMYKKKEAERAPKETPRPIPVELTEKVTELKMKDSDVEDYLKSRNVGIAVPVPTEETISELNSISTSISEPLDLYRPDSKIQEILEKRNAGESETVFEDSTLTGTPIKPIPEYSKNNNSTSNRIPYTLVVNSNDRNTQNYPSTDTYVVEISPEYKEVVSINLVSAEIPKTEYILNSYNNTIYFQETNGVTLSGTVPVGNYTVSALLTAVQLVLNTVGSSTYTVTQNSLTGLVSITSNLAGGSNIFNLIFDGGTEPYAYGTRPVYPPNSIGEILGFGISNLSGSPIVSQGIPNLNGTSYLYLSITNFNNIDGTGNSDIFAKITLDVAQGAIKYYNHRIDLRNIKHFSPPMGKLSKLNVRFLRPDKNPYNFNGMSNSFTLEVITQDLQSETNFPSK